MRKLVADCIYPITSEPIFNGMLVLSDTGVVLSVLQEDEWDRNELGIEYFAGSLCPGFVNAHCHLELSHLRGHVAKSRGLVSFIKQVQSLRNGFELEVILDAMQRADKMMYDAGIVAVGDVVNSAVSRAVKLTSSIYYHSFVELFGFLPERAQAIFDVGVEVGQALSPLSYSMTAHAPYSVSEELFNLINNGLNGIDGLLSIHNQETAQENLFFQNREGDFLNLYDFFGIDISFFKASGKSSLQTYLPYLSSSTKLLLVHNTFTSNEDISFAERAFDQLFWALCPKANLYIENRLPDIDLLRASKVKLVLGTDSLASNGTLSIWDEIVAIRNAYAHVPLSELLCWATLNGADFLGLSNRLGSFDGGKQPGVVCIQWDERCVKRII